jgi:hypothetical protein
MIDILPEISGVDFESAWQKVNSEPYFLGKVTCVVLFVSMLDRATDRPSDIDLAVQIAPKEADFKPAGPTELRTGGGSRSAGRSFWNVGEVVGFWH